MGRYSWFPVGKGLDLPLRGLTLPALIQKQAKRYGGKTFLHCGEMRVSYQEFDERTDRLAKGLQDLGIEKGDHVALMFQNGLEIVETYFGIWKTGAWAVPLNPMFTAREIKYTLMDSDAKMIVLAEKYLSKASSVKGELPTLETIVVNSHEETGQTQSYRRLIERSDRIEPVDIAPDDVCQIIYTSGTEGEPKGVMTTHGGYSDNAFIKARSLEYTQEDITLIALPLFHMFAMGSTLLGFLTVGGSAVIMERFDAKEVLEALERYRITSFTGVPTMYHYLLHCPEIDRYDLSPLRICIIAGGNVNYKVVEEFESKFNCLFIESMGQTELSSLVMINPPHRKHRRLGSCGLTAFNMETRLVDEMDKDVALGEVGELIVRSPCVMKGYFNRPEATDEVFRGGWHHTGDLLRQDKDGYYYFVDRKKDMIITGGYNIYAKELENVLLAHPDVLEAAVIAVPDEVKGQLAKALIVLKEKALLEKDALEAYARENLAAYKIPRIIEFVDSLPKTPQGKIAKGQLRQAEVKSHAQKTSP